MDYREITIADVPALFAVRVATDENQLTRQQLTSLGITEGTVTQKLRSSYRGWLCEESGCVVGFAIGNRATGDLWVIAVLPGYVGRGIGSTLLRNVEEWLRSEGCHELWLTTDEDTRLRAYSFYRHRGWEDDGVRGANRYMKKKNTTQPGGRPNAAEPPHEFGRQ